MQFLFGATAGKLSLIDLPGQTGVYNETISGTPDIRRRAAQAPA
jgi:hypothetical protein